jgi:hypothetical protein
MVIITVVRSCLEWMVRAGGELFSIELTVPSGAETTKRRRRGRTIITR